MMTARMTYDAGDTEEKNDVEQPKDVLKIPKEKKDDKKEDKNELADKDMKPDEIKHPTDVLKHPKDNKKEDKGDKKQDKGDKDKKDEGTTDADEIKHPKDQKKDTKEEKRHMDLDDPAQLKEALLDSRTDLTIKKTGDTFSLTSKPRGDIQNELTWSDVDAISEMNYPSPSETTCPPPPADIELALEAKESIYLKINWPDEFTYPWIVVAADSLEGDVDLHVCDRDNKGRVDTRCAYSGALSDGEGTFEDSVVIDVGGFHGDPDEGVSVKVYCFSAPSDGRCRVRYVVQDHDGACHPDLVSLRGIATPIANVGITIAPDAVILH
ncbi:unnamed protein product [Vitrella brassicaformis CCMP3155]|uniref:Uncharacterized protein n=2 Tax=Vitrella brassicaformis TaxID=1169539 RepID=A0A0G4EAL0_VITBC|nr:unnamed protein product [Vitrella brassicaformis CCMP3155]|eukprot:CEL93008.1 unnamed protein product [Vitrella brassicaformis CCMP3155]